jgi:hypothetical protein
MRLRRWFLRALPLFVSTSLLAGIIWYVSPEKLMSAAAQLRWELLLPATAVMVIALYLWDAFCLPAVYAIDGRRLPYGKSLHVRGLSYLGGALNYELGQAAIAWGMARLQQANILQMLSRSVLLAYHDAVILLAAGLVGAMLTEDERVVRMRPYIAVALVAAIVIGAIIWSLPARVWARIMTARVDSILAGWSLRRSLRLVPLRFGYFGILVVYAAIALAICRISVDHKVVLSTIPLVLLAEGLPNFAGLGTRETSLQLLLAPREPAVLLAMSLIWSTGMLLIRFVIGLAHLCCHQLLFRTRIADHVPPPHFNASKSASVGSKNC